jgi:hypothetical protein
MRRTEVAAVREAIHDTQAALARLDTRRQSDYMQAQYLDGVIDGLKRALVITRRSMTRRDLVRR